MDDVPGRLRRWGVPGIPFLFSLTLSLPTSSTTVFWQDSGFYLTAVHEFSVLYPHGFVLYLSLCKAWTFVAAPILGFTLSVHLFSAFCAAGAAAFAAKAAAAFLDRLEPGTNHDLPAVGAACLFAAGYSVWHAALLAKTYALFYLALAGLLWHLASAERRSDFLKMGVALGLCWAAHPSAALLVPAMLGYAWARRDRIREWGWGWVAAIVGLAAAAAFVPVFFLPLLSARESPYDFGAPRTAAELVGYVRGDRFTAEPGAFGFEAGRAAQAARVLWEDLLGVGLLLLGLGAVKLARTRPALLGLMAAWIVPIVAVTVAFRQEGQIDMWLVSTYLPIALLVAAGLNEVAKKGRRYAAAALAVALVWSVAANARDVNQRGYPYAEQYARFVLKNLDPGSILLLSQDDSIATVSYLRAVKGERRDVSFVVAAHLGLPWYDARMARTTGLSVPAWEPNLRAMPGIRSGVFEVNAFANENVRPGRPVFSEVQPDLRFLRPDLGVVPAGMLWKTAVREEARLDPRYWEYPADLTALAKDIRRARGILWSAEGGIVSKNEPYEHRLILRLLHARLRLADLLLERAPKMSLEQYEIVRGVWPAFEEDEKFLFQWGSACFLTGKHKEAEVIFRALGERTIPPRTRAISRYYLGEIAFAAGRRDEARALFEEALRGDVLEESWKQRIQARLRQP